MSQQLSLSSCGARPSIAIVVQGRFHAFALARELIALGMDVSVLTNYPKFVAKRFGVPVERIHSAPLLGLLNRISYQQDWPRRIPWIERFLHTTFSRWAGKILVRHPHQFIHCFSGVALDLFQHLNHVRVHSQLILGRGSAHILDQHQLLTEEEKRVGHAIEKPSSWMIAREMAEYQMADKIVTLSSFARNTFVNRGFDPTRLPMLPLAADTAVFRPSEEQIVARRERLKSKTPLTVLATGTFCLRKGAFDFVRVARELSGLMKFRWVGNIAPDSAELAAEAQAWIDFLPRVPEHELPRFYHDSDIYFFPTIEDGFAVTLSQAQVACLPIFASRNCAAPDMVTEGLDGWIFNAREQSRMIELLTRANFDRESILAMVSQLWGRTETRTWKQVGLEFLRFTDF